MTLAIILLLLGFGFVLAEVFFPSFGVLSLLAGASIIGAVVAAFEHGSGFGWTILIAALCGLPGAIYLAFKLFPRTPLGSRMLASGPGGSQDDRAAVDNDARRFVGRSGTAASALRPAGIATFGDDRLDVVTRGEHIEAGTPVRALRFVGNRLVVEPVSAPARPQSPSSS
ncbi:MAG TPA: NfeD family protein [Planctomycetota bacterium]